NVKMPSIDKLSVGDMVDLVGHPVTVTMTTGARSGTKQEGNVFTFDPITTSVVLAKFNENSLQPVEFVTVMGDSIESIDKPTDLPPTCRPFSRDLLNWMNLIVGEKDTSQNDANSSENVKRRNELVAWLTKNYVTVCEKPDGSVLIFDAVRVTPPFRPCDCICDNAIVLDRVRNIVAKAGLS
ncbi:hypothetical protein PFISCL1PPCAC_20042, partial [Pristionchus fissidentatus]